jgi:hypothetical protein
MRGRVLGWLLQYGLCGLRINLLSRSFCTDIAQDALWGVVAALHLPVEYSVVSERGYAHYPCRATKVKRQTVHLPRKQER